MLKGETIIYFGPEPWAGLWRNRHQLMSRFAAHNDVWYVEPQARLRQMLRGKRHRTRLSTRDKSGVRIFHSPWWLPLIGRPPLKNLSIRLYLSILTRLAGLRQRKPIVWLARPNMIDYIDELPAKLTIYHIVDEYSGYGSPSEKRRQELLEREAELLRMVDLAIVVTPSLQVVKSEHNANTHLVKNAADFAAYADCASPVPDDMRNIRSPVIGYSGLIAARLDLAMLIAAADARPDWSFVFVGSVNDDHCRSEMDQLRSCKNVHMLGQKPIADMPAYVNRFDVCTIPYAVNLRAQHASPLKLYEYAAASRPIVATDFAAAHEFGEHIEIVRSAKDFVAACQRCLGLDPSSPPIVENRRFAAKNTWDKRVEQVSEIIRSCL